MSWDGHGMTFPGDTDDTKWLGGAVSNRRMEALRAMAEQDDSPEEREIARAKLAIFEAKEPVEQITWEKRLAIEAERQRLADEETRAAILRRWEQGAFAGVRIRTGAVTEVRFEPSA